ncbi:MAG: hypothetical protein LBD84_00525 [Campylobacteraceae bacterium]|nr:hypothetical protein [Campylobacteraceae bacterium]
MFCRFSFALLIILSISVDSVSISNNPIVLSIASSILSKASDCSASYQLPQCHYERGCRICKLAPYLIYDNVFATMFVGYKFQNI